MVNLRGYGAIRTFFMPDGNALSIFRSPSGFMSNSGADRWVMYGPGVVKSAYVTKSVVAKCIVAYRQPGQITGLSIMEFLIRG